MRSGSVPELIDDLAAAVLERYQISPRPPVDIFELARQMGVAKIETERMVEDGRLEYRPKFVRILLKSGMPDTRHRFTLAHELGHLLLANPDSPLIARRFRPDENREERFCDAFAAAVLLPARWVDEYARTSGESLATARAVAQQSKTSLAASTVRLRDVLDWRMSLLRWQLIDDQWRFGAGAGVPRRLHGHIKTTAQTARAIEACRGYERAGKCLSLPLGVGGKELSVSAELMVFRQTAIALVDLSAV